MADDLPLEIRLQIDRLCDAFEAEWQAGQCPNLERFLNGWSGVEAQYLFARLQEIDSDYREQTGDGNLSATYSTDVRRLVASLDPPPAPSEPTPFGEAKTTPERATQPTRLTGRKTSENRFLPGQVLANRYRIVALLGRGGMGEVYRADDIRLGETVALKFLPERHGNDERHLKYFYDEVRLSQRLTHPHICRVHDLLEFDGLRCLSMEYIEGENLQTLLRRVGPLPERKALELAHQICQALAAAHSAGVLHRDMKTANIMIDERGRARVTDFGLARENHQHDPQEALVGSPAYMAPEQLARNATSIQSDLYSLGLILFEILIGRPAHATKSLEQIAQMQALETAKRTLLEQPHLTPQVVTAIATCLSEQPAERPRSASALAASLPGSSPLSVALAAGETPSPDMVAAVDSVGAMLPWQRLSLIVAACGLMIAVVFLSSQAFQRFGVDRAPAALDDEADELLNSLGVRRGAWRASGFAPDRQSLRWLANPADPPLADWASGVVFWYRESDRPLAPHVPDWKGDGFMTVDEFRPVADSLGHVHLRLDGAGRLRYLFAHPRPATTPLASTEQAGGSRGSALAMNSNDPNLDSGATHTEPWQALLEHAGLSKAMIGQLISIEPDFAPPGFADERRSWTLAIGDASEDTRPTLRINAAGFNGVPCFFQLVTPWHPNRPQPRYSGLATDNPVVAVIRLVWVPALLVVTAWLARRNHLSKRADREGANRLAVLGGAVVILFWLCSGTHVLAVIELDLLITTLAGAALMATLTWATYVAFEPFVRRNWAGTLVGWTRLLQGRFMDSLVGRDILVGIVAGAVAATLKLLIVQAPVWFGWPAVGIANIYNFHPLDGLRSAVGEVVVASAMAILYSLFFQLLFLLSLRLLVKRTSLATVLFVGFLSTMVSVQYEPMAWAFCLTAIEMTITATLYLKVGLLAAVTMHFVRLLLKWPFSSDPSVWYAETGGLALVVLGALLAFAAFTTRDRGATEMTLALPAPTHSL